MAKTEKMDVFLKVTVPAGTSRTKVEKALKTLLANAPEGYKIGSPKVAIKAEGQSGGGDNMVGVG